MSFQVAREASKGAEIFVIDGGVYDFSAFAHPGGKEILRAHAGEDVSEIFRGHHAGSTHGGGSGGHEHSATAHRILHRLRVGRVALEAAPAGSAASTGSIASAAVAGNKTAFGGVFAGRGAVRRAAPGEDTPAPSTPPPGDAPSFLHPVDHHRRSASEGGSSDGDASDEATLKSSVGSASDVRGASSESGSEEDVAVAEHGVHGGGDPRVGAGGIGVSDAYGIDKDKPLVAQVGGLGDRYMEWVHVPEVTSEPLRFFGHPVLEALSKTSWWVIPVVWMPLALWALSKGVTALLGDLAAEATSGWTETAATAAAAAAAAAVFAFGWLGWGLMEYSFHRFIFHGTPSGKTAITLHFILHGCHHKAPMDGKRLVFPPAASAPIIFAVSHLFKALAPSEALAWIAFAGCLTGYVVYDCTHYFLHYATFGWSEGLRKLKSTHMAHHYKDCDYSFGITNTMFDRAFGTLAVNQGSAIGGGGGGKGGRAKAKAS